MIHAPGVAARYPGLHALKTENYKVTITLKELPILADSSQFLGF